MFILVCRQQAADIVFVADASTSIGPTDFKKLLAFIGKVVHQFDVSQDATRVGLITFSNSSKIEFNLDTYTSSEEIQKALSQVTWTTGLTYTAEAIQMMLDQAFSPSAGARGRDIPKVGIIITDGNSREPQKTYNMATAAQKKGIRMFAIGIIYRFYFISNVFDDFIRPMKIFFVEAAFTYCYYRKSWR